MDGHEHDVRFGFVTGPGWLAMLLLVGVLVAVSAALLRPALGEPDATMRLVLTVTPAASVLVLLLLVDRLDVPAGAVVLGLGAAVAAVVVVVTVRWGHGGASGRVGALAPWVLGAATVAAGYELVRAWTGAGGEPGPPTHTALMIGLVGLSWLYLCDTRSRWAAFTVHVPAWLLGNAVTAATTQLLVGLI